MLNQWMPSLGATKGCQEAQTRVGQLVTAITHFFLRWWWPNLSFLCHLLLDPAGNRTGSEPSTPLPQLLPSTTCRQAALFVVRFLGSSSVAPFGFACLCDASMQRHVLADASRVDLLFPLATTKISPIRPAGPRFNGPHQLRLFAFAFAVRHHIRPAS